MIKSSTKPDQWTLSPQMTAAPELWRNVAFFAPLWEGNGYATDLVTGTPAENKGGGAYGLNSEGMAFEVTADGHGFYWPVLRTKMDLSDLSTGEHVSIHILVDLAKSSPGAFDRMIEISDSNSSNPRWNIYFDNDVAGSGEFVIWNSGDGEIDWHDVYPGTGLHSFTVCIRNGGLGNRDLYIDGVDQGTPSDNINDWWPSANSDAVMSITDPKDGIDNVTTGNYYLVIIWKNRRILAHEAKLLHDDPFAMLRPAGF